MGTRQVSGFLGLFLATGICAADLGVTGAFCGDLPGTGLFRTRAHAVTATVASLGRLYPSGAGPWSTGAALDTVLWHLRLPGKIPRAGPRNQVFVHARPGGREPGIQVWVAGFS